MVLCLFYFKQELQPGFCVRWLLCNRLKKTVSDQNGDLKICKAKLHMLDTQLKNNLKGVLYT